MWFLDFTTLLLIIVAGLQLGIKAVFDYDLMGHIFGAYEGVVFTIMGLSAIWQLCRQHFF